MRTVWQFVLIPDGGPEVLVEMPKFAKPVHVEMQFDKLCLWAEVDTTQPIERRQFYVFGTGHEMPDEAYTEYHHLGSGQTMNFGAPLVLHVYEKRNMDLTDDE